MASSRKDINEILERWKKKGKKAQLEKVSGEELERKAKEAALSSEVKAGGREKTSYLDLEEIVPTGIEKLDNLLMNGIPRGYSILVQGTPGSGFELLAKQFAMAGAGVENVVYYATNESAAEVIATMRYFNWPTNITIVDINTQYYEKVLQKELEVARIQREGITISDITDMDVEEQDALDVYRVINFHDEMLYDATSLEPPFRIIIDSIDFFFEHYPPSEVIAGLRSLKTYVQNKRGTILVTSVKGSWETKIDHALQATMDIVLELEISRMGSTFENRLIIKKVRNRPDKNAILFYSITENGLTPEMVMRVA